MSSPPAAAIRIFIALAVEPGLRAGIGEIQRRLEDSLPRGLVRWVAPEQMHLTLKFLGDVPSARIEELSAGIRRACRPAAPFQVRLEGLGSFPKARNPRVVWLGVQGKLEPFLRLQQGIETETSGLGNHGKRREFHPHLTIGRVKAQAVEGRKVGEVIERGTVQAGAWSIREVELVRSQLTPQGARYSILETVRFSG
jgi:RNA 2',3'-cyclic 3'-phosphodiesterase